MITTKLQLSKLYWRRFRHDWKLPRQPRSANRGQGFGQLWQPCPKHHRQGHRHWFWCRPRRRSGRWTMRGWSSSYERLLQVSNVCCSSDGRIVHDSVIFHILEMKRPRKRQWSKAGFTRETLPNTTKTANFILSTVSKNSLKSRGFRQVLYFLHESTLTDGNFTLQCYRLHLPS